MTKKWLLVSVIGVAIGGLVVAGLAWRLNSHPQTSEPQTSQFSHLPAAPQVRHPSSATPYCVAVRGNGELAPAHWGALARTFETYGAPEGMAGGSSASMTTFLWESAIQNPLLSRDSFEQGRELALMFKALEGVTSILYEQRGWSSLVEWVQQIQKTERYNPVTALFENSSLAQQLPQAIAALKDLKDSGVFYGPAVKAVSDLVFDPSITTDRQKQNQLKLRIEALKQSLAVFGKFDAKNDAQLFVRAGVVDFQSLAERFGALGDFLALRNAPPQATAAFKTFLETCLPASAGQNWSQITAQQPQCRDQLAVSVDQFFANYKFNSQNRVHDPVGKFGKALVTTSVVSGPSAAAFREIQKKYASDLTGKTGAEVRLKSDDLHFGFWGPPPMLQNLGAQLQSQSNPYSMLDKSKRFKDLGPATWKQALALSPAEPGLSPALEFSSVGLNPDWISFGGWSDLHPIPVLKAAGCERVVYVTRRGGDSPFSIGVVKRLLGFSAPGWELLDQTGADAKQSIALNNNGSDAYPDSLWNKLYNLRNPDSSYAASIAAADAVLCTDWNSFDVKTQFTKLIQDAYAAPMYESRAPAHSGYSQLRTISPADNVVDPQLGYAPYAGCIPL